MVKKKVDIIEEKVDLGKNIDDRLGLIDLL